MQVHALVLDNSDVTREQLIRALQGSGLAEFRFTQAKTYPEAVSAFDPEKTDIVFIGIDVHNLNTVGLQLIGPIRGRQRRHVPVVAVTNDKVARQVEQSPTDIGIDYYVIRPFTDQTIGTKMGGVIEKLGLGHQRRVAHM